MGNFYRVTKKIGGRLYDYWQRTYRVGKSVKTENVYIGPTGKVLAAGPQYALMKKNNYTFIQADRQREANRIAAQGIKPKEKIDKSNTSYFNDPLWHEEHGMGSSPTEEE